MLVTLCSCSDTVSPERILHARVLCWWLSTQEGAAADGSSVHCKWTPTSMDGAAPLQGYVFPGMECWGHD